MKKVLSLMAVLLFLALPVHATVTDTESPVKVYTSGAVTAYPIPFDYIDDEDIEVKLYVPATGATVTQTLNVDYTIVSDTVTYSTAPGSAYHVIIRRVTPFTQEGSWVAGSAPPLSAWESAFDKLTFITQDLNERLGRSILQPENATYRDLTIPDPVYNAGKFIRVNAAGTGYEGAELISGSVTFNMAKLSDYASFAAMVTAIGSTEKTVFIDTAGTLSADTVLPATMQIIMQQGGSITLGDYDLTINGQFECGLQRAFICAGDGVVSGLPFARPEWFGAYYGADCTSAIQQALDAVDAGGRVLLQPYDYLTSSTLTIKDRNRVTLEGDGLSSGIKFSPSTNDDIAIAVDGDCDNVTLSNFNLVYSNNNSKTGGVGVRVYTGATAVTVDRVYFADWLDKGMEWDVAYYAKIRDCRFMNCDNSTLHTALGIGLYITGANNTLIEGCQFTENDYALRVLGGNNLIVRGCSFESNGNSGNSFGVSAQAGFNNVNNLIFDGNYVEGNYTGNTTAFLDLDTCFGASIRSNIMGGQTPGNVDVSNRLIGLTDSKYTTIENNVFAEWLDYCVTSNNASVIFRNNKYTDGGTELTAHNDIAAVMSITGGAEFGIPVPFTWDPGSLADGAGETKAVTVAGATAGDAFVVASPSDLHDATATAYFFNTDTAEVRLQNESGGTLDLPSGTWYLHILKKR